LACHNLGNCYFYSKTNRDVPLALQYYLKAADTGNFPNSCQAAARIYRHGADGVPQDFALAEKYYKLALEKIRDPAGRNLIELGDLYNFLMHDYGKAMETYQRAAEKGNDVALFNLGNLYMYGKGCEENVEYAYKLFLQAADKGHQTACMVVGKAYLSGIGLPTDLAKAVQYMEVAAKSSSDAQFRLGLMYLKGPKSIHNVALALENLGKSAEQRNAKACFELAKIYYEGLYGVPKDLEKAKMYYDKAEENGKFAYFTKPKSFASPSAKPQPTAAAVNE
jgi:TPR repeat protein